VLLAAFHLFAVMLYLLLVMGVLAFHLLALVLFPVLLRVLPRLRMRLEKLLALLRRHVLHTLLGHLAMRLGMFLDPLLIFGGRRSAGAHALGFRLHAGMLAHPLRIMRRFLRRGAARLIFFRRAHMGHRRTKHGASDHCTEDNLHCGSHPCLLRV